MNRFGLLEEKDVDTMIESAKKGMHRTIEGQMVKIGSNECREDLMRRLEDAGYMMNDNDIGTEARSYYSGIKKVLRRKLKENDRLMQSEMEVSSREENLQENRRLKQLSENNADRILKLAGLID